MKKNYMTPEMINVLVEENDILTLSTGETGKAGVLDFTKDFSSEA